MPYKDTWYAYEIRLRDQGFRRRDVFYCCGHPGPETHGTEGPLNFDEDYWSRWDIHTGTSWDFRRLLKEFITEHRNDYFKDFSEIKIVKGIGYWKDLNPLVYELWVKVKPGLEEKYKSMLMY